jgi:hypothetical protein
VPVALEAICRGLADGELSPEEVETLTRSVEGMARTLTMYDADARMERLERMVVQLAAHHGIKVDLAAMSAETDTQLQREYAARLRQSREQRGPELAPATDQQAPDIAPAANLQCDEAAALASATNQQADKAEPAEPPIASATNQQAPRMGPTADAPPDPEDGDWLDNFLGPLAHQPWHGFPADQKRARP